MRFGVFDHMDYAGGALHDQYESRLKLAEAYDAAGFRTYHVAEHHSTTLGMAPSPSVLMAAVAQRTTHLRFGPLVYPLQLYHPLRLAEEISMLDHMSGGRFEFGVGKGASPHELVIYGVDPADTEPQFAEALSVLKQALTQDRVDFHGKFYTVKDAPIEIHPLQKPMPPMWYGVSNRASAARAAKNRYNFVCNMGAAAARPVTDAYRAAWTEQGGTERDMPLMGLGRFVIVAETDREAEAAAARAYPKWYASFWKLWDARGGRPAMFANFPDSFEKLQAAGLGVAGAPQRVLDWLRSDVETAGATYLVCRFAYGDLTTQESLRSVTLFAEQVAPQLAKAGPPIARTPVEA